MSSLPSPGDLVGSRFRVEAEIGRGSMGVVFRGREPSNPPVAIKVLLPETVATPGALERFTNEVEAARVLKSEHTVRVFDAGTLEGGLPYIVMELLEGKDFSTILEQRGPLPIAEACDVVIEACDALAEAHARGMVHRDLKPGNLFAARGLDGSSRVKVLDFGLSKIAAQNRQLALTSTGTILGTPHYMAPEQLRSSKDADSRADIWSLGVILYELVSKKEPFDGNSFGMLFSQIVSAEPRPLASLRPDVPSGLAEIVHRCLKKNRDERFEKVSALVEALAPFASPEGAALAKRIVEGPVQRPSRKPRAGNKGGTLVQGARGGTLVMGGPPPSVGKISVPSPTEPAPPPRSLTPTGSQQSVTPGSMAPPAPSLVTAPQASRGSVAPSAQSFVPPTQPVQPASAPVKSREVAQPSRNVLVAVAVVVVVLVAIGGVLLGYLLRGRGS